MTNCPKLFNKILIGIFIIGSTISSHSQTNTPHKTSSTLIPLDPSVKTGKLANGFTYYIRRNVEPKNRAQLYLAV